MRVWALEAADLPSTREAYGPVDALVVGGVARSAVSTAQVRGAADYVLGGGRIIFTSLRALEAFEATMLGPVAGPAKNVGGLREAIPALRVRAGTDAKPRVVEFPVGLGRCVIFADGPTDERPWLGEEMERLLDASGKDAFVVRPSSGLFVDAGAFGALEADRPFALGGARGRTVALVGALVATVAAALLAGKRRAVAGAVLCCVGVGWALVALLVWREPTAAARFVRVRALSADGRAEAVADTAVMVAFDREAALSFETPTGPPLPVARRPGKAFAEPFVLEGPKGPAGAWRISGLEVSASRPYLVRASAASGAGPDTSALRMRVLEEGARVGVTTLPGGGRKLGGADGLARDVRYLLERFAPPCDELAWVWIDGAPEGADAPECDVAPGSGTLVVAGVPTERASD